MTTGAGTGDRAGDAPADPADAPLADVEAAVQEALARQRDDALTVLGYGEITLVVGWPAGAPRWACKRLPVFTDAATAARYRTLFDRYLGVLVERGVQPVPSELRTLPGAGGTVVGYVVQPVLPPRALGPEVLRAAAPDPAHPLVQAVCRAVPDVVDPRTGIDGQISNWALVPAAEPSGDGDGRGAGHRVQYLDVTTPMLFDSRGDVEIDLDLFLAAYPWPLRAPIRRFVAPGVIRAYRDPRHVLVDLAANLLKERLDDWVPAVLDAANDVVRPAIAEDEIRAFYRSDARLWETMLRLRRADRWWQSTVRRRPYPVLLPGPIER